MGQGSNQLSHTSSQVTRRTFFKVKCILAVHSHCLCSIWMMDNQTTIPSLTTAFFISLSPFHLLLLLFLCWAWTLWGFAAAIRVWDNIRGSVTNGPQNGIRLIWKWCIQWRRASCCSHDQQHCAWKPWGSLCCAVSGTDWSYWAGSKHGCQVWPPLSWGLGGLLQCNFNLYISHMGFSLMFPSRGWNWLYLQHRLLRAEGELMLWK